MCVSAHTRKLKVKKFENKVILHPEPFFPCENLLQYQSKSRTDLRPTPDNSEDGKMSCPCREINHDY
jgi:hypothetical protein